MVEGRALDSSADTIEGSVVGGFEDLRFGTRSKLRCSTPKLLYQKNVMVFMRLSLGAVTRVHGVWHARGARRALTKEGGVRILRGAVETCSANWLAAETAGDALERFRSGKSLYLRASLWAEGGFEDGSFGHEQILEFDEMQGRSDRHS